SSACRSSPRSTRSDVKPSLGRSSPPSIPKTDRHAARAPALRSTERIWFRLHPPPAYPMLPSAGPGLQRRQQEGPIAVSGPHEPVRFEVATETVPIQNAALRQPALLKEGTQLRQARQNYMAIEGAEIALVPSPGDHLRKAISEGQTRKPAIPDPGQQQIRRHGQNMLHDGLAEQRMYEISRSRPQTVPAEQLTIRQTKDLAALARRKIVAILQPGVTSALPRNGAPGRQRQPGDCPCRMPRPSTDLGPV